MAAKLIARVLVAALFVINGAATTRDPVPRAEKAAWFGHPAAWMVRVNGAGMVGLGLIFVTGYERRWVAAGLIVLLALTTLGGHAFWREARTNRGRELTQFLKNAAIIGGLLMVTFP